ncbi:hypothetical protein MUK42_29749 [Musa troglodytarum]|uniref:Uncharacterized protein n=1 Tax=Musa troglodytarum TaxID=320322 RepID=A0A9E7FEE6_9LILI|nr:hypothetical protein MUK42_29749 [Musa troglodytarum]
MGRFTADRPDLARAGLIRPIIARSSGPVSLKTNPEVSGAFNSTPRLTVYLPPESSSSSLSFESRIASSIPITCKAANSHKAQNLNEGTMTISVPNKHDENEELGGLYCVMNEKAEPLVAFNKPRLPPVLGPLVVLSFLEMLSSNGDD